MLKFEDIKDRLLNQLELHVKGIAFDKKFTLVTGFFNQPIQDQLDGTILLGGTTVPMVAIVENDTGRMYFFALKVLLPDIDY